MSKEINVPLIQSLKGTAAGAELLRWIENLILERRQEVELGSLDPNDAGRVGVSFGSLQTLHLINETLLGEYQGELKE